MTLRVRSLLAAILVLGLASIRCLFKSTITQKMSLGQLDDSALTMPKWLAYQEAWIWMWTIVIVIVAILFWKPVTEMYQDISSAAKERREKGDTQDA